MVMTYTGRNNNPDKLNINNFRGYNTVDDASNLKTGYLVKGSKNIDLARERGALGKALGRSDLITSLGASAVKGMYTYQRSSGDIPLFGHGTSLYKLTGTPLTIAKTTDADFNAGTFSQARAVGNAIVLNSPDVSLVSVIDQDIADGDFSSTNVNVGSLGQTFTMGAVGKSNNISKISIYHTTTWSSVEDITLTLYTSTAKTTTLGTVTVLGPQSDNSYTDFVFSSPISVTPGTQYYFEITISAGGGCNIARSDISVYSGGVMYENGVSKTYDMNCKVYGKGYYTSGTYTSQSLDLGQTPVTSSLAWTATTPANTGITFQAKGSADNSNWGDWQNVLTGGATPRTRYIQVKATLTTTDTTITPALSDFTITYTTAYDTATAIKTGLTGNRVVGCNYNDQFYFTDGGRPQRYDGTLSNFSVNGDFEVDTAGWVGSPGGTISRITADKNSGIACLQVVSTLTGSSNNVARDVIGARNNRITVSFYAKSISGSTSLHSEFWGGFGADFVLDGTWKLFTYTVMPTSNETFFFWLNAAGTYLIDDVTISKEGIYNLGIDPPLTAPSGVQGAGTGIGAGTYYYKIAYLNDIGGESSLSPASAGVTIVANKSISLSSIPISPLASVTGREIYRTKATGDATGPYYFVAEISNNTATTYTDTTADAALVTPPEDDVGLPPNCSLIYEHKNYMMYATGNRVYFSKVGEPDHVAPLDYKQFPGTVLSMKSFQGALVVGGDNFSHAVFGDIWDSSISVDDTSIKVISNSFGPVSHDATQLCNSSLGDILVFPTRKGLSYISQGFTENTVQNSLLSAEVQDMFDNAVNRGNMAAIYNNYEYTLAMDYYGAETPINTNNLLMKYDLRGNKWNPPIMYGLSGLCEANGMLLGGSSTAGIVYQMNSGNTDAGGNIHAVAVMSPLSADTKTKFNRVRVKINDGSVTDTLQIKPSVDGTEGTIAVGATSTWAVPTVSPKFRVPCQRGYELQLKFEDDSTNDFIIASADIEYEGGVI